MDYKTFCNRHNISIESELVDENPNMTDMPEGSYHWKVTLKRPGKQMTLFFSMGPALTNEPTAEEVLECLAMDSYTAEDETFEEWCGNYGYDTDSRKAERCYNATMNQAGKLVRFLGELSLDGVEAS